MTHTMRAALALAALAAGVVGAGSAHAELTIWQVENNPPGQDSGNEWLTLVNTGAKDTFGGYGLQTTNGRIASYGVPTINLDTCEPYRFTFAKQAIDNEKDTVILHRDGVTVYQTPVIKDTKNDDRFWTNPDVAAVCGDAPAAPAPGPAYQPPTDAALEQRIAALEAEISVLHQLIQNILDILNGLLGT